MSGAEMQLVRMTPHMEARGHAVATLDQTRQPRHRRNAPAGPQGATRVEFPGKLNVAAVPGLARAARRYRADIVQSTLSTASWWSGWLERCGGPPSIGHVQGFTSAIWHRHQSHLLAVSHAVKLDLIAQGIDGDRIHRAPQRDLARRILRHPRSASDPRRARRRRRYACRRHVCPPLGEKRA